MRTDTQHRLLQFVLLVLWIAILVFDSTAPVCSQGLCVPPLVTPRYMDPITITNGSWVPSLSVTVRIDSLISSFGNGLPGRIEAGQRKWNPPSTCAGVVFSDFGVQAFTQSEIDNHPPDGRMYWLVAEPTGIDGSELFGNFTAQPEVAGIEKNGFLALAEFDKPIGGGYSDGQISSADAVFASLRLWQDSNQNGISEANELHTLSAFGLAIIELEYKLSKKEDEYGNQFRYRAKVKDRKGEQIGRWAWDVFLLNN